MLGIYKLENFIDKESDSFKLLKNSSRNILRTLTLVTKDVVLDNDRIIGASYNDHIEMREDSKNEIHIINHEIGHILINNNVPINNETAQAYLSEVGVLGKFRISDHLCKYREAYCEVFAHIMDSVENITYFPNMYKVLCKYGIFDDFKPEFINCINSKVNIDYTKWYLENYSNDLDMITGKLKDMDEIDLSVEFAVQLYYSKDKEALMSCTIESLDKDHFSSKYTLDEIVSKYSFIVSDLTEKETKLAQLLFVLECKYGEDGMIRREFMRKSNMH